MIAWWEKGTGAMEADLRLTMDECGVPDHMHDGILRYVLHGIIPGTFLSHIFENDFVHAAGAADEINQQCLWAYAMLLHNLPQVCWGSVEKMTKWNEAKGMVGLTADEAAKKENL